MPIQLKTKSITAENVFTDPARLREGFNISVSGTFVATVTLQKSYDVGVTWLDVMTYAAPAEDFGFEPEEGPLWRIGVKTGAFTSGQADVRLSQ